MADICGTRYANIPHLNIRVSEHGIVWEFRGNKLLHMLGQYNDSRGYPIVRITRNGIRRHYLVHRLVLEAFVGVCPNGYQCRHLDGDPSNCHISNLCWGTTKENDSDKDVHGTRPRGENHKRSKLKDRDIIDIRRKYSTGKLTAEELRIKYKMSLAQIYNIINRTNWSHIVG